MTAVFLFPSRLRALVVSYLLSVNRITACLSEGYVNEAKTPKILRLVSIVIGLAARNRRALARDETRVVSGQSES
ncbi:MAG: hypothetical protein JWQ71_3068 [Pedosphaera sp.]|nr:hypothetical protein [Pedosphaera sp.]